MNEARRKGDVSKEFPVGLRVLAVDGDVTYLRILESQLRSFQYNVTTISEGKGAVKMLREKRNEYDLVITAVDMPNMDGFKLLELVRREMDLPIILLFADDNKEAMLKGLRHGAHDCLMKPVETRRLQSIWVHVVRRRSFDHKTRLDNIDDQKSVDTGPGPIGIRGNSEEEEEEEEEEQSKKRNEVENEKGLYSNNNNNSNSNNNNANRKKPRLIWTRELHAKFVAAVNYLGLDKAVPKKILEIMNEKSVTRENVASHLQKYRLHKKKEKAGNQQAHMAVAMGGQDSHCLPAGSLNFPSSIPQAASLGHMNTQSGFGLQASHANHAKFQPNVLSTDQTAHVVQGLPASLQFSHPEHKILPYDNPSGQTPCYQINQLNGQSNSSMILDGQSLDNQNLVRSIINPKPSMITLDNYQYNHTWSNVVQPHAVTSSLTNCYQSSLTPGVCPASLHDISSNFPVYVDDTMQNTGQLWDEPNFARLHMEDFEDNSMVTPFASPGTYSPNLWHMFLGTTSSFIDRNMNFG